MERVAVRHHYSVFPRFQYPVVDPSATVVVVGDYPSVMSQVTNNVTTVTAVHMFAKNITIDVDRIILVPGESLNVSISSVSPLVAGDFVG